MKNPEVIGVGTYGCVHRPPIKCIDKTLKIDYNKKISKLMREKDANSEMNEYLLIDRVDPKYKFHMETPVKCSPETSSAAVMAIEECEDFDVRDVSTYKLLVMPDGGINLNDFAKMNVSKNVINKFWSESQRILYGLKIMMDSGIVHHDFKPHNVVYNKKTNRTNYIDFGFMREIDPIFDLCRKSNYDDGVAHWSFPYEFRFINKDDYLSALKTHTYKDDKQLDIFVDYVTKPGIYRQQFKQKFIQIVDDMFKYDLTPENYDNFMEKSIKTIDVYGIGMSFLYVLNAFESKMNPTTADSLRDLFNNMITPRVSLRYNADEALSRYESILAENKLL